MIFFIKDSLNIAQKNGLSNKSLTSALSTLNLFRNICAHNNRIYNYKINNDEMQLSDLDVHCKLNIPKDKNNKYIKGKNDLFAVLISLKYLLSKDDFNDLVNDQERLSIFQNQTYKLFQSIKYQMKWDSLVKTLKLIKKIGKK